MKLKSAVQIKEEYQIQDFSPEEPEGTEHLEDAETEDETPALKIYMKRNVNLETERHTLSRTTDISVDEIYTVALADASKVVLATFKK